MIKLNYCVWFVLLAGIITGCTTSDRKHIADSESACVANLEANAPEMPPEVFRDPDDLLTVDCLLPGQVIRVGMYQEWITPPRPAKQIAWECRVQGGQYALGGSNGLETAQKVWQGCANQGDKVAQNYMGEIYSRSWGEIKPDYVRASEWYRKSAEQGYSRALNNLGFLYEHGLGVPKNKQTALNFYRQAMGEISPIKLEPELKNKINELEFKRDQAYRSARNLEKQYNESKEIIQQKQNEINTLKQLSGKHVTDQSVQIRRLQNELAESRRNENTAHEKLEKILQELNKHKNELTETETQIVFEKSLDMGKYYALVIGINHYQPPLPDLATPTHDAKQVEEVLRKKYGFETTLLVSDGRIKPTRSAIFQALFDIKKKINNKDNLLIYFAGHGEFYTGSGYWLAQDAQQDNLANWLSTDDLTRNIQYLTKGNGGLKARHVLVVADSCYGAAMAMSWLQPSMKQMVASLNQDIVMRSGGTLQTKADQIEPAVRVNFDEGSTETRIGLIKKLYELPSRVQLTSGGMQPVIDKEFKNGLSVFANAFIEALDKNHEIINARNLFSIIEPQVYERVKAVDKGLEQTPTYRQIPNAGDNNGEFFFIPLKKTD